LNEALHAFNFCRRDAEYCSETIGHMVEIYLNPGGAALGGEASFNDNSNHRNSNSSLEGALVAAERLLQHHPSMRLRHRVLHCRLQMASGEKLLVEESINELLDILNEDKDFVPALFVRHMYPIPSLFECCRLSQWRILLLGKQQNHALS
jgi:hypothetical protein